MAHRLECGCEVEGDFCKVCRPEYPWPKNVAPSAAPHVNRVKALDSVTLKPEDCGLTDARAGLINRLRSEVENWRRSNYNVLGDRTDAVTRPIERILESLEEVNDQRM